MPLFEPIAPQRYLAPFRRALEQVPAALATEALRAAGLHSADPEQHDAVIPLEKLERLIEVVTADPDQGDFGVNAGLSLAMEDHGPLAQIFLRAHTLEARLRLQAHYFRLITPIFSWQFTRFAEGAELVVRPAIPFGTKGLRVVLELYAAAHAHNVGELIPEPQHAIRIHLPFSAPSHIKRYRIFQNVRFTFSRPACPKSGPSIPMRRFNYG